MQTNLIIEPPNEKQKLFLTNRIDKILIGEADDSEKLEINSE